MKKTIYKYFFNEFVRYFIITLFTLSVIVWTVQAVNFLDLVTEDGHAFTIYFSYSFLTLSKVLTKLIPFCFLIATVLTILKLEKDNELIVLWTSGLNKIHIVNLILRISLLVMFLQLLLTTIFNPTLLNLSRSILKNSQLEFIPSLLKEKKFNDTVEGLTIFVDKKNENNIYENIFIQDEGRILSQVATGKSDLSSTIFAKSGYVTEDDRSLVLFNGSIQKYESDENNYEKFGKVSIVKFYKTEFDLVGISTKSISETKMQETSTIQILQCLQNKIKTHNCDGSKKSLMDTKIEINKRFGMPIYIPLIGLVCCFLLTSRRDTKNYFYNKYIYSFIGILILSSAEIIVRYSGISWGHMTSYYTIPLVMIPIFYLTLIRTFKYENLT